MAVQKLFDSDLMDSNDGITKRFNRLWKITVANINDIPQNDPGLPAIRSSFDAANPRCLLNSYSSVTRQGPYEYTISGTYATDDFGKTWTFPPTTDEITRPWDITFSTEWRKIPAFVRRFSTFRDGAVLKSLREWVRDDIQVSYGKFIVNRKVSVAEFGPTEIAQIKEQVGKWHAIGTIGNGFFAGANVRQLAKNNVEISYNWVIEMGNDVPSVVAGSDADKNSVLPPKCPEGKTYRPRPNNTGVDGGDRDSGGNQLKPEIDLIDIYKGSDVVTNPSLPGNPTTP